MVTKIAIVTSLNGLGIASGIIPSAPFGTGGEIGLCLFVLVVSIMLAGIWQAVSGK
jgi:hypothetical protein